MQRSTLQTFFMRHVLTFKNHFNVYYRWFLHGGGVLSAGRADVDSSVGSAASDGDAAEYCRDHAGLARAYDEYGDQRAAVTRRHSWYERRGDVTAHLQSLGGANERHGDVAAANVTRYVAALLTFRRKLNATMQQAYPDIIDAGCIICSAGSA